MDKISVTFCRGFQHSYKKKCTLNVNVCTCVYVFVLSDNVISVLLLKRDFALFFGCTECVNNFHIHSYIRNAVESTIGLWGEDCVFQSSPCD